MQSMYENKGTESESESDRSYSEMMADNPDRKGVKELVEYKRTDLFKSAKEINDLEYLKKMVEELQWKYADCMERGKKDDDSFVRFKKTIKDQEEIIADQKQKLDVLESIARGRELKIKELEKKVVMNG